MSFTRFFSRSWSLLVAMLAIAVALFSYRYLAGGPFRAPQVLANPHADPFLILHVAGAATALLVGPFQFIARFRRGSAAWHRWTGRIYVLGCLLGGAAGLPLALGSTAGPVASAGFGTLAILWFAATAMGWRRAMQGRIAEHRVWMLHSWAMTFAAVTLRLYLPVIPLTGLSFVEGYRIISWICWVPNLLAIELWLAVPAIRRALHAPGSRAATAS